MGGAEAGFKGESGDRLGLPACVGLLMHIHEYLLLLFFLGGLSIRLLVCVYFALFCGMFVSNGGL